ncbi:hypothetical protein [Burkholderia sp. IMCC1007]|uniref:hypothetical protein n=1 Tax=Burkholderia sp. IMCC1007 TaxID=3004104 RepID=UPI0022B3BD9A|nr:hypothetical protein [Burkholderia sp. IMCC1007]
MHGVLTVERSCNEVTHFRIDTARTRNLNFVREMGDSSSSRHFLAAYEQGKR